MLTAQKLALAMSTISAFVFYVCGAAPLYALSVYSRRLRDTSFAFVAPWSPTSYPGATAQVQRSGARRDGGVE